MTSKQWPSIHSIHLPLQSRLKTFCGSILLYNFLLNKQKLNWEHQVLNYCDIQGLLTLAMGKCLWFSVKIKVCQLSLSSPWSYPDLSTLWMWYPFSILNASRMKNFGYNNQFYIKIYRKHFLKYHSPPCASRSFCMYMCYHIFHFVWKWLAGTRGGEMFSSPKTQGLSP